ncbi:response regulator transcription factor [Kitasatospora sp. MAP5-34]|uniref:helix-turn-helix transcriptional regulator n=1 Tax=Kitasatospora sp. MAP5-34 TaxID=3035102 RepID=UPI002474DA03|nr:response regulator transcription factor [Kitasatospora sp. MAP5-34]MDH6577869.1 DNA-binding NarL/FixJ family response regulator [Kitasatospora sp. MAP5-34]
MERVAVFLHADDPISQSGVVSQLRMCPELRVLDAAEQEQAAVLLVVADSIDPLVVTLLRRLRRRSMTARLVLVVSRMEDSGLATAVECGVVGLVRRAEATSTRLTQVITAAARGEGTLPPDLLGRLLDQVGRLQRQVLDPRGISFSGLAAREIDVLKLVAEGRDTREIAEQLAYSERTVKNVLHDITSRLQLRNRSHAVAYALREGLI